MKVFISYSQEDKMFVLRLSNALMEAGIETWVDEFELRVGDNLIEKINQGIQKCDFIIAVLSPNFINSQWTRLELNAFVAREVSENVSTIIPVLIEDCNIPVFLRDKMYADFRHSFDEPVEKLIQALRTHDRSRESHRVSSKVAADRKESSRRDQIRMLRKYLRAGDLVLVCGAGVSVAAGVPTWPALLRDLLSRVFGKNLESANHTPEAREKLADLYQEYVNPSPLVVAQYLKNALGDDFLGYVRQALYRHIANGSELIDSIVELCRPQRSGEALRSILTFNFDDLIEHNLDIQHVRHHSIFTEGQKAQRSELPIYHAHGFLPRIGDLTPAHEVVFSEDAYHSQFIDSFSWANLTQLNHFSQNVCTFVGVSMTDPNLRRLLDVSMRKNPGHDVNHYIFRKRHSLEDVEKRINSIGLAGDDVDNATDFTRVAEMLEETDANNLGMNVIWIDDFNEIPAFLREMGEEGSRLTSTQ